MRQLTAVATLLVCINASAQNQPSALTMGVSNGRWWQLLSEPQRISYLSGLLDGLMAEAIQEASKPPEQRYVANSYFCDCKLDDLSRFISQFYAADSARQPLTIIAALAYAVKSTKGASADQINREANEALAFLRSAAPDKVAEVPAPPPPSTPHVKPIQIHKVVHFRSGEGYGCMGHLDATETSLEWSEDQDCWGEHQFEATIPNLQSVVYDDYTLGTSVSILQSSGLQTVLSMSAPGAQKLLRHLRTLRPSLSQRCFLARTEGNGQVSRQEFNCSAW